MPSQLLLRSMRVNYLYADKYVFPSVWVYPQNRVPYCMLRLIQNGSGEFTIDGETLTVRANDIVYIPQGSQLHCRALEDEFTFVSVRFTTSVPLSETEDWSGRLGIRQITRCDDPEVLDYFERMALARASIAAGKTFRLRGYLELIMAYLIDANAGTWNEAQPEIAGERYREYYENRDTPVQIKKRNMSPELKMDTRIQTVVEYLIAHREKSLDTKFLCEMVELSESSLRRLFKEHTGKSPGEFVNELKLITAARQLLESNDRVSDIAAKVGFDDPNYFARMFKLNFGVSPREYRRISRE